MGPLQASKGPPIFSKTVFQDTIIFLLKKCHFCGFKIEELFLLPHFNQLAVDFCFFGHILGHIGASMIFQKYFMGSGGVARDVEYSELP